MKEEKIFSVTVKDLEIQTFQAGGKGGQHQNRTSSGVRVIHRESKAVGVSRTHRSQRQNKKAAFLRMVNSKKFRLWVNRRVFEITGGKSIEQRVEEQMNSKNIKIEIYQNGKWVIKEGVI